MNAKSDAQHQLEDIVAPSQLAQDPYPIYRTLRDDAPIYWSDRYQAWVVSRYDDVKWTLTTPTIFSSAERIIGAPAVSPEDWPRHSAAFADFTGFFWSDPPSYTQHRKLWTSLFRPQLASAEEAVGRIVNDLISQFDGRATIDGLHDIGLPLPATVIFEFLGIPEPDRPFFREVTEALIAGDDTAREAMDASTTYLTALFRTRQNRPTGDMISSLVRELGEVGLLSEEELRREAVTIAHFVVAGHETTASAISSGLLLTLRDRDIHRQLRDDPELIKTGIEEFLRYESPLQFLQRRVSADTDVHGALLKRGDAVWAFIGSANRDERAFPEPDELVLSRRPNRHLAFGFNIHFCIGAPLARLETEIVIRELLRRFPDIRLASGAVPQWREIAMFRMLQALPLALT